MSVRTLFATQSAFRISDARFDIRSGFGAALLGGRWNSAGNEVLYTSETYAAALLEKLVYTNIGKNPETQVVVQLELPLGSQITELGPSDLGLWIHSEAHTQDLGDAWIRACETLALRVPSIVARPFEHNLLLNPRHPDFTRIVWGDPQPVQWDSRIFGVGAR